MVKTKPDHSGAVSGLLGGVKSGSGVKNLPANAGDSGSTPGSGRSPGERNGNPLQFSCLEIPMERGAWQATVYGHARVRHDLGTKLLLICGI